MAEHTERFTGRAEDYERFRLRYPAAVIEILAARCGLLREHMVADIGAGTGMLAEMFLEHGNAVVAIEPNDDMRAACEGLASLWPGLLVSKATAEATGLDAASMDFVAVGRAFHWFDQQRTKTEFRRILRQGGWVVLVSNGRVRDGSPLSVAYETLLRKYGTDYAANRERYEVESRVEDFFAGCEMFREEIAGEQLLTLDQLVGQTRSLSVTPEPGHAKYAGMLLALNEFFNRWAVDGQITMRTVCKVAGGQFKNR